MHLPVVHTATACTSVDVQHLADRTSTHSNAHAMQPTKKQHSMHQLVAEVGAESNSDPKLYSHMQPQNTPSNYFGLLSTSKHVTRHHAAPPWAKAAACCMTHAEHVLTGPTLAHVLMLQTEHTEQQARLNNAQSSA
jgi:hypothetical protein